MTLTEVMIAVMVLFLMAAGLLHGVLLGTRVNYAAAQRTAAFGLCIDLFEQMRNVEYTNLVVVGFPKQTMRMTHLGGSQRVPLMCERDCSITELADPERKLVQVRVDWTYQGRPLKETLAAVIYRKP